MTGAGIPGDPTPRTIEQVRMAIESLRELFEAKFENIETKFAEADKAVQLLQETVNSQPTPGIIDERLTALKESVDKRFQGVKELRDALAISDKESLNLALQAAEKAATKAEAAFNKQLDAVAERVNDIKDRTINMEASEKGSKESGASSLAIAAFVVAALGGLMSLAVGITILMAKAS
jgi:hypothetical protein